MRLSRASDRDFLAVLLGSAAAIGGALLFQYAGGLAPCELCLLERWPYYVGIPVTLVLLLARGRRPVLVGGGALVALIFLASSALAFYHVGVEQHWFAGPTACTGGPTTARTIEELQAQLLAQQPVRCDVPQWTLVGVSLAGWNLLASLALTVLSWDGLRAAMRERPA
jgi:disulfide bond formation protein DsbB